METVKMHDILQHTIHLHNKYMLSKFGPQWQWWWEAMHSEDHGDQASAPLSPPEVSLLAPATTSKISTYH